MQLLRICGRVRVLMALALIGIPTFTIGCDSGGDNGQTASVPATPPPGQSGKEQAEARAKLIPTGKGGAPAKPN
jgi:hypothetical protein